MIIELKYSFMPKIAMTAFKKVDYQVAITYGAVTKEDGSVYENAAYEFIFIDNNSDMNYSGVYQPDKTKLSERDMLTIGIVNDMFSERERDEYEWVELATDSDMAAF